MILGIAEDAWRRINRSVQFTERREQSAGGRQPLGLGSGSPVWVKPLTAVGSSSDLYNSVFQHWDQDTEAWVDADEPNTCYARDANGAGLDIGTVYMGAVTHQYADTGEVLVQVGDGSAAGIPAPSVTPLNCPVSSPDACCLPDDVGCCPTIYYEMATSPSTGQLVTGTSYYVDCDGRRVYEDSPTWAASDTCAGGWGDGMYVQCSPHPATGELRYYYESIGCRTCDEIVAAGGTVDDCVSPNPINGPVCVTIAGGTGAFSGVTGTSTSQEIGPDLSVRVDFEFPTLVVSIDGSLVFNAGEPGGWYFVGTATSTQDAGSVPYECGCQVTIPMGLLSGSGVTQTVTAGPVLGSPPTQTLLVETPCGDFTLAIGACPVSPPAPTYNCAEETYCYDPGDGTGTYTGGTALADCEAACGGGSTPPVPSGCCDGTGESLEGNPNLELVIPNGYLAGTYTLVYSASVLNLSGGYGPGWYVDVTLVAPFTFRLVASCTAGRWYLAAVSGFPVSGNLGVMYSAVCDPFAVLFLPDSAGGWSGTASLTVA